MGTRETIISLRSGRNGNIITWHWGLMSVVLIFFFAVLYTTVAMTGFHVGTEEEARVVEMISIFNQNCTPRRRVSRKHNTSSAIDIIPPI